MENLAPLQTLTRRSYQLYQIGFIVLALGALLTVVGLIVTNIPIVSKTDTMFSLLMLIGNVVFYAGVAGLVGGIGLIVRARTRRRDNDLALMTGDFLIQTQFFDPRFLFVRNLNPPGAAYTDAVLIGPPGALVFRIVDNIGAFACEGANWLTLNKGNQWVPLHFNPTKQAVDDVQHLRAFFAKHKLADIPVFGIIVFTATPQEATLSQREPVVPACNLTDLLTTLQAQYLTNPDRVAPSAVAAARRLLLGDE
jgi:hypothetical protein